MHIGLRHCYTRANDFTKYSFEQSWANGTRVRRKRRVRKISICFSPAKQSVSTHKQRENSSRRTWVGAKSTSNFVRSCFPLQLPCYNIAMSSGGGPGNDWRDVLRAIIMPERGCWKENWTDGNRARRFAKRTDAVVEKDEKGGLGWKFPKNPRARALLYQSVCYACMIYITSDKGCARARARSSVVKSEQRAR